MDKRKCFYKWALYTKHHKGTSCTQDVKQKQIGKSLVWDLETNTTCVKCNKLLWVAGGYGIRRFCFFVLPKWMFVALFHQLVMVPFLSLFLTINRSFSSKTSQLGQGSAPGIIQHCQNQTGKKICCDPWNQQLSSSKSRRFRPLKTHFGWCIQLTLSFRTAEEQFVVHANRL